MKFALPSLSPSSNLFCLIFSAVRIFVFAMCYHQSRTWWALLVLVLPVCQVECMLPTSLTWELANGASVPQTAQHQTWLTASSSPVTREVMDSLPCMSTYSPNLFAGRAFPEIPQHQYLALAVAPLPGPFDTAALTETYSDHRFQSQGAPVYSNLSRTPVVPSAPPTAFFPRDHMQATQFDGNPTHMRYVVSSATRPPLRRKDSYYSYMPPDLHVSYGWKLGHMGDSAHFKECRGSSHAMSFGVRAATGIPVTTENLNPMADEFNFSRDLSETGREIEKYDSQEDLNSNGKAAASASSSSPVNDPDQTKNQRELRKTLQAPPSKIGEVHGPDIDHPPEFKIDSHIMYDGGVTPDIGKGFIDSCKHCLRKSLHIRSPTADENDSKESVKVQNKTEGLAINLNENSKVGNPNRLKGIDETCDESSRSGDNMSLEKPTTQCAPHVLLPLSHVENAPAAALLIKLPSTILFAPHSNGPDESGVKTAKDLFAFFPSSNENNSPEISSTSAGASHERTDTFGISAKLSKAKDKAHTAACSCTNPVRYSKYSDHISEETKSYEGLYKNISKELVDKTKALVGAQSLLDEQEEFVSNLEKSKSLTLSKVLRKSTLKDIISKSDIPVFCEDQTRLFARKKATSSSQKLTSKDFSNEQMKEKNKKARESRQKQRKRVS